MRWEWEEAHSSKASNSQPLTLLSYRGFSEPKSEVPALFLMIGRLPPGAGKFISVLVEMTGSQEQSTNQWRLSLRNFGKCSTLELPHPRTLSLETYKFVLICIEFNIY